MKWFMPPMPLAVSRMHAATHDPSTVTSMVASFTIAYSPGSTLMHGDRAGGSIDDTADRIASIGARVREMATELQFQDPSGQVIARAAHRLLGIADASSPRRPVEDRAIRAAARCRRRADRCPGAYGLPMPRRR
jgi:hypothetical protein